MTWPLCSSKAELASLVHRFSPRLPGPAAAPSNRLWPGWQALEELGLEGAALSDPARRVVQAALPRSCRVQL